MEKYMNFNHQIPQQVLEKFGKGWYVSGKQKQWKGMHILFMNCRILIEDSRFTSGCAKIRMDLYVPYNWPL